MQTAKLVSDIYVSDTLEPFVVGTIINILGVIDTATTKFTWFKASFNNEEFAVCEDEIAFV